MTVSLAPALKKEPDVLDWDVVTEPELSVAVGSVQVTVVPEVRNGTNVLMLSGHEVTTGSVESVRAMTVTSNVQSAGLPAPSVHLYRTVVVCPTLKLLPETGLRMVRVGVPTLSVAVGSVHVTGIEVTPNGAVLVKDSGQLEIVGGMTSTNVTVTSKLQMEGFKEASVKVYVTVVVPMGNEAPETWVAEVVTCDASVAVGAVQKAWAPAVLVDVREMSLGQPVITGGVVSTKSTFTVNAHVSLLPKTSVKV